MQTFLTSRYPDISDSDAVPLQHEMTINDGVEATPAEPFRDTATAAEQQLAQMRFALDFMSQGLAVFDTQSRLVLCNANYRRIYKLSAEDARPGISLRDLIDLRTKAGTYFGDPDFTEARIHREIARGATYSFVSELIDGRAIAIEATPMGGGAWVATHQDITEHWRAQRELSRTKNFLDMVIDHVPVTILVKDAATLRYVLINKRGEDFFEMPRQGIIGKRAA
jgi:PAS domain-containing protein